MLELSDYDENEEASAHKSTKNNNNSGNVECVEVNNGIKMANKRSKSLEKEKEEVVDATTQQTSSNESVRRPETAPPLLLAPRLSSSSSSCSPTKHNNNIGTAVVANVGSSDSDFVNKEMKCDDDDNADERHYIMNNNNKQHKTESAAIETKESHNQSQLLSAMTWHEHVYQKLPKMPTPYSIIDILQWGSSTKRQASDIIVDSSDKNNNRHNNHSSRSYQSVEPSTLQHLLNLNINSPKSPRSAGSANNQNNSGISSRGLSFSETSEDESVASDQPLNLCVIKSRDSSPGGERSGGKNRKGE